LPGGLLIPPPPPPAKTGVADNSNMSTNVNDNPAASFFTFFTLLSCPIYSPAFNHTIRLETITYLGYLYSLLIHPKSWLTYIWCNDLSATTIQD
jgi:hypothetical protein